MKVLKALWMFCRYVYVPQRRPRAEVRRLKFEG